MTLHLDVTRYRGRPPGQPSTLDVGTDGATLGRNQGNTLVLDDPERMVSGLHARIEYRDQTFWFIDQSTNGTFLNGSAVRLAPYESVSLNDGDTLVIGPYEISVSIHQEEPEAEADPFEQEEFALPGIQQPGPAPDILDLLGGSAVPERSSESREMDDPFADAQPLDSFLGGPAQTDQSPREAAPHHTPVDRVHFRPPESHPIPEGYDLLADELLHAPSEDPVPHVSQPRPLESDTGPDLDSVPIDGADQNTDSDPKHDFESDLDWEHALEQPDPFGVVERTPAFVLESEFDPTPRPDDLTPARMTAPSQPPAGTGAAPDPSSPIPAQDPLAAFLAGLGTGDPAQIKDPQALLYASGALLRALTGGLTATMMARAQFKNELRLGVTTIRRSENNPFKFSVSPDEALERLLLRPNPGFLPPLEASQEAFEDIQAHEMAMIAGLRAALRALLARFEPNALEARLGETSGLDRLLPMARKSRYWELFTETYGQVANDAAEDFMQLFGESFSRAYEDQILRLAQARARDPRPR